MGLKAVSVIVDLDVNWGVPQTIAPSFATAYQAQDPTRPAILNINLNSVAALTLGGGTTNTADIIIGTTPAVAAGTGTVIGKYRNTMSGTVVIGIGINTDASSQIQFLLPIGWYWAIRQTAGTVSIVSAFEQAVSP